jgi:hypothetical protein
MRYVSRLLFVLFGSVLVQLLGSACGGDGVSFAPGDAGAGEGGAGAEPVVVLAACDRVDEIGREYATAVIPGRSEEDLYRLRVVQALTSPELDVYTTRVLAEVFVADQQAAARCNKGAGAVTFVAP